ncbi:MAG: c-type cytochrome [Pseudomonas sp.]
MNNTARLTFALVLSVGLFSTYTQAAGDVAAGAVQFKQLCGRCHQVGKNARSWFGPPLNGIVGRHAASIPGYEYSDAMKASAIVWTPEILAAYVKDPSAVVPGTRMSFWGLSDPEKIDNLLAYLQTFQQ